MGELGAMFNPGMRHELEERQSKASRREEEGNARDGDDLRIDLASGVAVIGGTGGEPAESEADAGLDATSEEAGSPGPEQGRRQPANGSLERRLAAARRAAARNAAKKDEAEEVVSAAGNRSGADKRAATGKRPVRPVTKSGRISR